jgi:predicted PurR-regulated permease PerM
MLTPSTLGAEKKNPTIHIRNRDMIRFFERANNINDNPINITFKYISSPFLSLDANLPTRNAPTSNPSEKDDIIKPNPLGPALSTFSEKTGTSTLSGPNAKFMNAIINVIISITLLVYMNDSASFSRMINFSLNSLIEDTAPDLLAAKIQKADNR